MDALRITWGMPLCVYYELEDARVTPHQHIARALGGPLFNLAASLGLGRIRSSSRSGTPAREIVDTALGANLLILGAGLLPYPGLDGGVILKWGLVQAGRSTQQADTITRQVDGVVAAGLAGAALAARKRRPWLSALFALLSLLGIAFSLGILRED
jgi:Zn-dependent protease